MDNLNLLNCMAFTFLLLLMLSYWSQAAFFGREKYQTFNNFIFLLSISSLTTLLIIRWIESGHFPLSNLYESLLFLSWCFLTLKLLFEIKPLTDKKWMTAEPFTKIKSFFWGATSLKKDSYFVRKAIFFPLEKELGFSNLGLGVILSPLSLLNFGFAFLSLPKEMQQSTALVPALQSNWLMMHVTVMVLSYAALISGSLLSIAFLILNRLETTKNLALEPNNFSTKAKLWSSKQDHFSIKNNSFYRFYENKAEKSIDFSLSARLDNYSYRILALGFPLLTIGILSGAVWANEAWGSYWSWDPKETWALITWLVFAIYLHTRITKGWSGEKPAIVASIGFFMVWFCYLGVNLLGTGLHSYGWFSK